MANTLRFKRGLVSGIPTAALGEPLFTTDTFDLYIGNGTGNTRFQKYIASGTTSQLLRGDGSLLTMPIVLTSPSNGQVLKFNGTNWVNDSDAGITGSGVANYLPKFTGATTLGNSQIFDNGTNVGIGTASPAVKFVIRTDPTLTKHFYLGYSSGIGANYLESLDTVSGNAPLILYVAQTNGYIGFTTGSTTEKMRLHGTGNLVLGGTVSSDNGARLQISGTGFFSDSVGIGTTSLTSANLTVAKTIATDGSYGIFQLGQIQTAVTGNGGGFINSLVTIASTNLTNYYHYRAIEGTIGASTTITNNFGYHIADMATGTNRFAFYGNVSSGSNKWNLYMNGTAANYLAGNLGVGSLPSSSWISTGKVAQIGNGAFYNNTSNVTAITHNVVFGASTNNYIASSQASAYWQINGRHEWYNAPSGTAGNAITFTQAMTLFSTGNLHVGGTSDGGQRLQVTGTSNFTGAMTQSGNFTNAFASLAGGVTVIGGITGVSNGFRIDVNTSNEYQYAFRSGTNTVLLQIANTGAATFSSSVTASSFIPSASTIPTNGMYLPTTNTLGWSTNTTERMRLDASGNLGLGVTPSAWSTGTFFIAQQIGGGGSFIASPRDTSSQIIIGTNAYFNGTNWIRTTANASAFYQQNIGQHIWFNAPTDTAGTSATLTQAMTLFATGNLHLGGTSDGGQRLQVTGTSNFTALATLSGGITLGHTGGIAITYPGGQAIRSNGGIFVDYGNGGTGDLVFRRGSGVTNTLTLAVADGAATFSSSVTAGGNLLLTSGTASSVGAINLIRTGTSPVASRLTFGTDGTGYSFAIGKNQGGSVTDYFTILDSGAATFSGTLTVSGGNGYQVINSASTTVTALRPTGGGTSIMSTNSNGIHIAVGTQANGDLILATNNTERLRLYRDGYLIHTSATNPTTSSTDAYLQYSADVVAGNAAPHFRTENGAVIKLYQETTSVGNAIFSQGGGNSVLDDSTFDGYTLRQIVRALRNQGILQ